MKYLLSTLALCISSYASADLSACKLDPSVIAAQYDIITQKGEQVVNQPFELWRNGNLVAHYQPNQRMSEIWQHLSNGQIRPIRYFEDYKHGIEYQSVDLIGTTAVPAWHDKYQLITEQQFNKMTLIEQSGEGCEQLQTYTLNNEVVALTVKWLPAQKLVQSLKAIKKDASEEWQLKHVITAQSEIKQKFAVWDQYQTTDYADVGDNESDPMLAKMIKLGFISHGASGFYNADGTQIEGSHHH
ncbi:hypothetical protein [Pseudoalteromonas tunicata]|uniref:hypothetical protein n=1 Tax=Pseudoalteromonas tunicata TaxID=314281 RepID=UPI00273E4267|nr:hypothetical protein [Pseudoalteromonas tunicata]MDP4982749.1 hypothetical protein [Pseudoalteromonas tunicata]MDP5213648.1 hypothetical protein [Pseudoalteromonas tunicata]